MRVLGVLFGASFFVACAARTELRTTRPHSPLCGNGVVDPGEDCDLGAANSDAQTFTVTQDGTTFQVEPLVRNESATSFYKYIGASSHTGIESRAESRLYLYVDATTNALSLVINHNIEGDDTGAASMQVAGLPRGFNVDLSDDDNELVATDATTATGNWQWWQNTDGGVIAGLCGGSWTIVVTPAFTSGISTWVWVDGDESRKSLDMSRRVTIASAPQCHTDCRLFAACGT